MGLGEGSGMGLNLGWPKSEYKYVFLLLLHGPGQGVPLGGVSRVWAWVRGVRARAVRGPLAVPRCPRRKNLDFPMVLQRFLMVPGWHPRARRRVPRGSRGGAGRRCGTGERRWKNSEQPWKKSEHPLEKV